MDDNKKFGDVSQEDIDKAKKAAPDDLKEKQPVNVMDEVFEWAESFVFAMFVVILIFTFFFRIVLVQGPSMRETLQDQDRLIITHINYTPQKGDIVVINSEKLGKTIIKRVIGTGGDKVVVDYNNNTVTVNGKVISNDNIREAMYNTNLFDEEYEVEENVFEYDVPEGKLFVMGDNRNNSTDSRRIGFIDPSDVLGKAVLRLEIIVMAMFVVVLVFTFVFRTVNVQGQSMQDTLFENDSLVISKLLYTPKQGDIVVVNSSVLDNRIIKRIIAVEGQKVEIDNKSAIVKVNGAVLDESYIKCDGSFDDEYFDERYYNKESEVYEYEVPAGCCFVMGDNRNHSTDSRVIGYVPYDEIVGRVLFRFAAGNDEGVGKVD